MKNYLKITALLSITVCLLGSCDPKNRNPLQNPTKVEIKSVDGDYNFYVNGEHFELRGAGGSANLAFLAKAGGNSIRTWSTRNAEQILDSAAKYNIMVAVGVRMGQELHQFDYNDTAAVGDQYRRNIARVQELKNHPNLLCWVVGNELNLAPDRSVPVNPKVYDALSDVVDFIHQNDQNHPVSTAFAGISKEQIQVALERCPDLDFLALQVYGDLKRVPELVEKAQITKPYAITEYGPIGHWERPSTEWGREIEEPSAEKASGLYNRIQQGIVSDPTGLCLGGYAFLWGQKQERTPTWYGMFLKTGEATAVVDELTRYWTGQYPGNRAPKLDSMTVNGTRAVENVYLEPGTNYLAKTFVSDPDGDSLTYRWEVLKEVMVRSDGGAHENEPAKVDLEVIADANGELRFVAPQDTGEYRLFSYVFDGHGKVGTANVPFYIKGD